jgi:hypothetical protein
LFDDDSRAENDCVSLLAFSRNDEDKFIVAYSIGYSNDEVTIYLKCDKENADCTSDYSLGGV